MSGQRENVRFRSSRAGLLAALVLAVCAIPLAFASPWLLVLLLLPVAMAWYVLRTGTSADPAGLTVRTLTSDRTFPWREVATLSGDRGHVLATTTGGENVRLPGVTTADVPRIAAASGGGLGLGPRS